MDNCGKRLGIAMTVVVVLLALNALAVITGAADRTYGRLLGTGASPRVAGVDANPAALQRLAKAADCVQSHPKQTLLEGLLPAVDARSDLGVAPRMC